MLQLQKCLVFSFIRKSNFVLTMIEASQITYIDFFIDRLGPQKPSYRIGHLLVRQRQGFDCKKIGENLFCLSMVGQGGDLLCA